MLLGIAGRCCELLEVAGSLLGAPGNCWELLGIARS